MSGPTYFATPDNATIKLDSGGTYLHIGEAIIFAANRHSEKQGFAPFRSRLVHPKEDRNVPR